MKKHLVILGAQWGDEGKGKIVDLLSEDYEVVVRYQGGSNAGHTVVVNDQKFVLHLIPTGMLHSHTLGVIAQGMVVDLELLVEEIRLLEERGVNVRDRLLISDRAHLVLPYHKLLDFLLDKKDRIGTTMRGIGPAYMFKYGRKGIRVADLEHEDRLYTKVKENVDFVKDLCEKVYCEKSQIDADEIYAKIVELYKEVRECVTDTTRFLLKTSKRILFEGAQGTLLDVDMGTYPYVTSSNSSALGLSNGTGLPPTYFSSAVIWGVAKAYITRVGEGPFPTELKGPVGDLLREKGGEYGATTGRPRRCGWLDLVALKHAVEVNHLDGIILTKLDVLDGMEEVQVCVAYQYRGKRIEDFPASVHLLEEVEPVYKPMKGWSGSTVGIKDITALPEEALEYVRFIENYTNTPVVMLSTGPRRDQYVWLIEKEHAHR
ncbi:adenylosuccinate synthetase [Thermocrinis albus DSM 14484]|uniref:Adenylosuccinate synthetase n=1 Tax=Thermocrinis albus (strain DSM 14484 / JCM 11386 / HI 11/12) TaxID=638303 RepID=D3SNG8_THEAH|nr:adenylosuccinate synthase [Thermocrinis albus]ADC88705.1 adenylosuccinate synthetase [Thermocrinis albus DSM 14484]